MMQKQDRFANFSPEEIQFKDVVPSQLYTEKLSIVNISNITFEIVLKPSSSERYEVAPKKLRLGPKEEKTIEIRLKIVRNPKKKDFNDYLMVHSEHFDYRVSVNCFLKHQQENIHSPARSTSVSKKTPQDSGNKSQSDREIEIWKQKNAQTEEENFILAQRIQELETDTAQLSEKFEAEQTKAKETNSRYIEEIREKNEAIDHLTSMLRKEQDRANELEEQINQQAFAESYFERMRALLREHSPDLESVVDIALKQEKLQNEKKNQKILQMFEEKDSLIAELERKIEDMNGDYSKMKIMVEDQRKLLGDYEAKEGQTFRENQSLKESMRALEIQMTQLSRENERFRLENDKLKSENVALEKLTTRIDDLSCQQVETEKIRDENARLLREIDELRDEISKMHADNSALVSNIKAFIEKDAYTRELIEQQKHAKNEVEKLLAEKDKLIADLQDRLFQQTGVLDHMLKQFNEGEDIKRSEIQQLRNQSEEALKKLNAENEQLKNELIQIKEQQHQKSHNDSYLHSNPMRAEELHVTMTPEKYNMQAKLIADLEQQVSELTQSIQKLQNTLEKEQRSKNELLVSHKEKVGELEEKIVGLQTARHEIKELDLETSRMQQQKDLKIMELEAAVKASKETMASYKQRCEGLEDALAKIESEKQRFAEEVEILSKRIDEKHAEGIDDQVPTAQVISKLNARVSNLKFREQKLLEENSKLESMYHDLKQEFEQLLFSSQEADKNQQGRPLEAKHLNDDKTRSFARSENLLTVSRRDPFSESEGLKSSYGENFKKEVDVLLNVKSSLENELMLSYNKEKMLHANNDVLVAEKNEIMEKNLKLKNEIQALEDQIRQQEQKAKEQEFNYKRKIMELQNELNSTLDKLDRLQSEVDQNELLNERLNLAERIKSKVESENVYLKTSHEEKITELNDQIHNLKTLNQEYKVKVRELEEDISVLRETISEYEAKVERLNREKNDANLKTERSNKERDEYLALNQEITMQVKALREEFYALKEKNLMENTHKELIENELKERISILQEELERARNEKLRIRNESQAEILKLTKMHQETIDMLTQENRDLGKKYFAEIQERKVEADSWDQREKYFNEKIEELRDDFTRMTESSYRRPNRGSTLMSSAQKEAGKDSSFNHSASKKKTVKRKQTLSPRFTISDDDNPLNASRLRLSELDSRQKDAQITDLKTKLISLQDKLAQCEQELFRVNADRDRLMAEKGAAEGVINHQKKELELLEARGCYSSNNDAKTPVQFNELKEYVFFLNKQRERNSAQSGANELKQHETEELLRLVKSVEDKLQETEQEASKRLQECTNQLEESTKECEKLRMKLQEMTVASTAVDICEKQIAMFEDKIQELQSRLAVEMEIKTGLSEKVAAYEEIVAREGEKLEKTMSEYRNELEKSNATIAVLREEMTAQSKNYEDTINIYEKQLQIMSEKFMADVKDLSHKVKDKEKKNLDKILESYSNNLTASSQKDSQISLLKDKGSKLKSENESLKTQLKKAQETVAKLNDELNTLSQKRARMMSSLKSSAIKPGQSVGDKSFSMLGNKENLDLNESQRGGQDLAVVEAKLMSVKTENRKLTEELKQALQLKNELTHQIDALRENEELLHAQVAEANTQISDLQRAHKKDIERLMTEFDSLKARWYSPEVYEKLKDELQEANSQLKELKDELQRKKDYIQSLKAAKDIKQNDGNSLKKENEQLQEEVEKLKRSVKEISRREATLKEFKEKYEILKNSEKALQNEKADLTDKLKQLKADLTRKDQAVKDMREKIDIIHQQGDLKREESEELEKAKDQLRKLKVDLERKEQTIKLLKSRIETLEKEQTKEQTPQKAPVTNTLELEKEVKRHEQTKIQLKKLESQYQNLIFVMRRLFRDTVAVIQKLKSRVARETSMKQVRQTIDPNKFSDSIDILNLSPEEIQMFVDAKSYSTVGQANVQDTSFQYTKLVEKFEEELNGRGMLNPSVLYDMMNNVIEERVGVEKKIQ